jgi:glycosyltransferase involved in cell wall biosynthesis
MPIKFTPPQIAPLSSGTERSLWSVMIPTYNRTEYLPRTLESVLAQDPGPDLMQIEVVDDCSTTDDPEPMVRALAGDRVMITRNPQNLGMIRNWNRCIERARGYLVHILHSDDYIEPTFYSVIGDLAVRHRDCAFLATRAFFVDETEVIVGVTDRIRWIENPTHDVTPMLSTQPFQCAGVVVRRALYERCGGFIPELVYAADWEMWVRAVYYGGGVVHRHPLANWRRSTTHETASLFRSGEIVKDFLRLNNQFSGYPGFSPSPLHDLAAWQARYQYDHLAARGDVEAAQVSLELYRALVPLPIRAARETLEGLRSVTRAICWLVGGTSRRASPPRG